MTEASTGYRTQEQVLFDLAKAYPFSPEALEKNRDGKLAKDQHKKYIGRCARPATMALISALAPILFWTSITAGKAQVSFMDALPIFFNNLIHLSQFVEAQGRWSAIVTVGTTAVFLILAAITASKISLPLYFDLLDKKVEVQEGRLIAREDQTLRANGRDPIEKYYFNFKTHSWEVSLAAYRALETGSTYRLYLLPRSNLLVSLEPKLTR
jgi:hypothetical protein